MRARTARLIAVAGLTTGFVAADAAAVAPRAEAAHHFVRMRQVHPGTTAVPAAEYVVLQLTAFGENLLSPSASVTFYDNMGVQTNTQSFSSNPPNNQNQRTVLVGTPSATATFGVTPDLQFTTDTDGLSNAGGAACLNSTAFPPAVDCVGWGALTFASPPSPIGTPEAAIPADQILERSIAASCPTLHETSDDTNSSAADFAPATAPATPRNNAAAIVETACTTLSVLRAGTGTGSVAGNGTPPIACPTTCFTYFQTTDNAMLQATPDAGSTFGGWTSCPAPSGDQCQAMMNTNRTITANFIGPDPPPSGGGTTQIPPATPFPFVVTNPPPPPKKCKKGFVRRKGKCRKKRR